MKYSLCILAVLFSSMAMAGIHGPVQGPITMPVVPSPIPVSDAVNVSVPILMYHEIVTTKDGSPPNDTVVLVSDFNAQMKWLRQNGYYTLTTSQVADYMLGKSNLPTSGKPIVISFDDGWHNQLNALPALYKNGFRATFNIIAGFPGNDPAYMNWIKVAMLDGDGNEVASHTMTHKYPMTIADAPNEIVESKYRIESHIGSGRVTILAWPDGYFTQELLNEARNIAGYKGTATIDENWCTLDGISLEGTPSCDWHTGNRAGDNTFLIKRVFVDGRCTLAEFATHVIQQHSSPCAGVPSSALVRTPLVPNSTADNNNDDGNAPRHGRDIVESGGN